MLQRHWLTVALGLATAWQVVAAEPGSPEARAEKQAALQARAANLAAAEAVQASVPERSDAEWKALARTAPEPSNEVVHGAGLPGKAERLADWQSLPAEEAYALFKAAEVEPPLELALQFNQSAGARPFVEGDRMQGDSPAQAFVIDGTAHGSAYGAHGNTIGLSNYIDNVPWGGSMGCPYTYGFDGNDAWYVFIIHQPTLVTASTCAATFHYDTRLGLFNESLDLITGNDDNCDINGLQSTVACCLDPGRYYLVVDSFSNYAGEYDLSVTFDACAAVDPPVAGGPDAFGYRWIGSGAPDGPDFHWFDITSYGTAVALGDDDYTATPIPIGFPFPFYGVDRSEIIVGSNGMLGFASAGMNYLGNVELPNPSAPNALIAGFWDDLNPGAGGAIHTYSDYLGRFIVQFTDVPAYGGAVPMTFQVILSPGGDILVQWLDLDEGDLASATVGIENDGGTDGLTANYDGTGATIGDGLAVRFLAPRPLAGGPDAFGYRWAASGHAMGPVFESLDISGYGTDLGITGDDQAAPVTLPFAFPFYGASYTDLLVSSNGYLTFGAYGSDYSNDPIPTGFEPNGIVCPFWDDLFPPAGGTVHYYHDTNQDRAIFQWNAVPSIYWDNTDLFTFQAILHPDGTIVYQYVDMPEGLLMSSTVGVENADGSGGLQVLNEGLGAPISDLSAIRITPPQPRPTRGTGGGYAWVSSLDPQGPDYEWVDISGLGTDLGITGDDQDVDVALPFAFPFYFQTHTTISVTSNGWLGFNDEPAYYFNEPIPTAGAPNNIVCPFWDDLYPPSGGTVHQWDDVAHGRVYFQWTGVPHINGTDGPYTFQAVLYQSGEILFYYNAMNGVASATVGVENGTGAYGCQVNYNDGGGQVANGVAVHLEPRPRKPAPITDLSITPLDFSPGNSTVQFDWTPPTTDVFGLPLVVDTYLFVTVETDPYDFSSPYVEAFPTSLGPPLQAYYPALGWLTSAYARIVAVDDDGAIVAASGDVPWSSVDEIPGFDRDAPPRVVSALR